MSRKETAQIVKIITFSHAAASKQLAQPLHNSYIIISLNSNSPAWKLLVQNTPALQNTSIIPFKLIQSSIK